MSMSHRVALRLCVPLRAPLHTQMTQHAPTCQRAPLIKSPDMVLMRPCDTPNRPPTRIVLADEVVAAALQPGHLGAGHASGESQNQLTHGDHDYSTDGYRSV